MDRRKLPINQNAKEVCSLRFWELEKETNYQVGWLPRMGYLWNQTCPRCRLQYTYYSRALSYIVQLCVIGGFLLGNVILKLLIMLAPAVREPRDQLLHPSHIRSNPAYLEKWVVNQIIEGMSNFPSTDLFRRYVSLWFRPFYFYSKLQSLPWDA
jgi:hypothetical protein